MPISYCTSRLHFLICATLRRKPKQAEKRKLRKFMGVGLPSNASKSASKATLEKSHG